MLAEVWGRQECSVYMSLIDGRSEVLAGVWFDENVV